MSICLSFTNTFIIYMYVYINDNSVREMNVVFIWGKWKILYFIVFRVLWCFIRRSVSISELKMNGNPGVIDAFVLVRIFFLLHFVRNYWYGNNKIIVLYYWSSQNFPWTLTIYFFTVLYTGSFCLVQLFLISKFVIQVSSSHHCLFLICFMLLIF